MICREALIAATGHVDARRAREAVSGPAARWALPRERDRGTVDVALVAFEDAKCSLQVVVVHGQLDIVTGRKQTRGDRRHGLGHVLADGGGALGKRCAKGVELCTALIARTGVGLQRHPHGAYLCGIAA
ncbi:MAG: hypothetical protein MUF54_20030 [Polyangiaceae bacterium]|nr:hypothetical protein [Polyangiaceae bacterium]